MQSIWLINSFLVPELLVVFCDVDSLISNTTGRPDIIGCFYKGSRTVRKIFEFTRLWRHHCTNFHVFNLHPGEQPAGMELRFECVFCHNAVVTENFDRGHELSGSELPRRRAPGVTCPNQSPWCFLNHRSCW